MTIIYDECVCGCTRFDHLGGCDCGCRRFDPADKHNPEETDD
jgi:hypothetical protein